MRKPYLFILLLLASLSIAAHGATPAVPHVFKNRAGSIPLSELDENFAAFQATTDASSQGAALIGFKQAGTGAVARTLIDKVRETVSVDDFGDIVSGSTDAYPAIARAIAYASISGNPKAVCFKPGKIYKTNSQINVPVDGVALVVCGDGSGYAYAAPSNTQTATILAGAAITNVVNFIPTETTTLTNYGLIRGLIINGGGVASRCINIAGTNLIQDVTTTGCTDAGIRLGDLTNQTHLERVASVGNAGGTGYGLLVQGVSTTALSVSNSNFRSNTIGVRFEAGVNVHVSNTVIESNFAEGLSIYYPTAQNMYNFMFSNLWLENNNRSSGQYALLVTQQTSSLTLAAQYLNFNNVTINATGSNRHVSIQAARFVRFRNISMLSGDQANAILLGTNCSFAVFEDRNGGVITDNGNRNLTLNTHTASGTSGIDNSGAYYERGYTAAMGEWQTRTFSAGNYTGDSTMTWTLQSGDVVYERWTLIGKTMIFAFRYDTTTVGGTPSYQLRIAIPGGFTSAGATLAGILNYSDNGTEGTGVAAVTASGSTILLEKLYWTASNWSAATNTTHVSGQVSFEIQ